jgi:hypothetical protein
MGQTVGDHSRDRGGLRVEPGQRCHCPGLLCQWRSRATVVQQASESFCSTPADPTRCAQQATDFLEKTATPLGWSAPNPQDGIWGWPLKILGLLISVGAATLGAPFWYRLLDRIGTLRNTGRPPQPGS